ncbi:dehydrogenase/reductase SDR family member 12 [Pteropus alecto]|uniref:dehydrogenase/reductase SDR family member 12 n=1 Tax=Pteropus alecto TaxID=9402 RepID=UPI000D534EC7|nr:dehydrogenase/reductase SDR family member 12 [Pteropus alecto]
MTTGLEKLVLSFGRRRYKHWEAEKDLKEINGPFFGVAELVANFSLGDKLTSRTGYESACEDFVPDDLEVQVAGRAFLVTGGKSGIGKATAIEIAKRGGTVHLVCRDKDGVQGAKGEIIRESGNQNIFLLIVDLSDPKKIWKFVENFKRKHKLNVLINNAGCMVNKSKLTEDGLEKNFATNTLDMYILMTALIPVLEKEHDPRVASVRLSMPRFHARFRDGLCSVAQGADTVLWLALAPAASMKPSGRFFLDWKSAATPLSLARTPSSPAEEEKLSEILEELAQRFK